MTARRQRVRIHWREEFKERRPRLTWVEKWEGKVENWAKSFINKNQWRCDEIHSREDLLQDAYLVYLKISDKYPRVARESHFMALYCRALSNQLHDHARSVRRKRDVFGVIECIDEQMIDVIGDTTNDGYLNVLLAEAPEELRLAMSLMENCPEAVRVRGGVSRENLNMKLRRALGVGKGFDFTGTLKNLLA